ncbi:hypothetical protein DEO72_LG11g1777 [Vigna unguiculata]|uniref:Uncharacterized protein n=1 Tax=Vigna unguiculata TaxID=3917 RepID=A0A4D6NPA4_VIGUN|nr:hypothetical protein DEO72_LG11g1777 [Vigna unguiculata]
MRLRLVVASKDGAEKTEAARCCCGGDGDARVKWRTRSRRRWCMVRRMMVARRCRCEGEKMCVLQNRGGHGRRWWCGNSRRRLREGASMVVQQCFPARTGVGTKLVCADAGEAVSLMVRKWWLPAWCSGVRRDWRRRLCGGW